MELKDFIKLALTEICDGIAEARTDLENKYNGNCVIAPYTLEGKKITEGTTDISFDIAVQSTNGKQGKAGLCLKVLDIEGEHKTNKTHINRVSFSVPFLPQGLRKK